MKKKVLTLLGALAALGLAACDPAAPASSAPASTPASSQPAASSKPASSKPASSKPASSSQPAGPVADATGHIWAADTDVAADTEAGTAAFKKAVTTTPATDKAVRYKVNQSVVTYPEGSSRKDDTPEGYTKLNGDGQMLTFKFKSDKLSKGKLYLFGVMDNYSSNTNQGLYYNGSPNVEVKVNNNVVDVSAWANHTYADYLEEGGDNGNSVEGYVPVGDVVLKEGVNEVSYKRVQTRNMLIKDFVFVVEETSEWSDPTTVAADATAGTVAYKKYVSNLDGSIKIEFKALDGTMAEGSTNKDGTPAGFLKLNSNGNNISYKFNFDANLDGKFYQRGKMDSYGSNKNITYYSQTKGAKHGNFKATLNGSTVYYGDKKNVTYGSMLGDNVDADNYSDVCDCLIGDGFLKNGENTFNFERVDSYNLAISDFVFIGKAGSAHAAPDETAEWKYDEISVWQEMPNDAFKWNRVDSEWGPDTEHPDEPATCVAPGKTYEVEKTSGLSRSVDTQIDPTAHAWVEKTGEGATVQNSEGKTVTNLECSLCHDKGARISVLDFSGAQGDSVDGSVTADNAFKPKKVDITYKIVVPETGYYCISLGMLTTSGNEGRAMSDRHFEVKVGGNPVALTMNGSATPNSLHMGTSGDPVDVVLVNSVSLEAGEVSISIKNPDYRMMFKGYVTIGQVPAPTPAAAE